jgi:hypothetical protein
LKQFARARGNRILEGGANALSMTLMELKNPAAYCVSRLCKILDDTAGLAEVREEGYVSHILDVRSGADVGQRQLPIRAWPTSPQKEISLVCFSRILVLLPCGKNGKPPINALRTFTAMRMDFGHVTHSGTTARMPDEIAASVRHHSLNYF